MAASTAVGTARGHYNLRADIIRRSQGYSVVSKSAYNARAEITNERTGEVNDYTRHRNKPLFSGFYAVANAPEWARTAAGFWNGVEKFDKRKDAQLARDILIELPHQISSEHARFALQDFIRENFTRKGYAVQLDIHPAHEHGDARNLHAHLIVALRKLENGQFGGKEQFKGRNPDGAQVEHWREQAAHHLNRQLARHGYGLQVDHRSLEAQGINREPTIHLGKAAAAMEREGIETDRGNINREIERRNAERRRRDIEELERIAALETRMAPAEAPGKAQERTESTEGREPSPHPVKATPGASVEQERPKEQRPAPRMFGRVFEAAAEWTQRVLNRAAELFERSTRPYADKPELIQKPPKQPEIRVKTPAEITTENIRARMNQERNERPKLSYDQLKAMLERDQAGRDHGGPER